MERTAFLLVAEAQPTLVDLVSLVIIARHLVELLKTASYVLREATALEALNLHRAVRQVLEIPTKWVYSAQLSVKFVLRVCIVSIMGILWVTHVDEVTIVPKVPTLTTPIHVPLVHTMIKRASFLKPNVRTVLLVTIVKQPRSIL